MYGRIPAIAVRLAIGVLSLALVVTGAQPSAAAAMTGAARGQGTFQYAGTVPMDFVFEAVTHADGSASGNFRHTFTFGGYSYDYRGKVTCLSVDTVNGRAWIGGVLTSVQTDDPTSTQQAGDDAWFRVLDQGGTAPDRSTAMGFVGAIPSSAAYCALRIWPADNARTWPVSDGKITVR
jgi:hypothetical protein